MLVVHSAAWGGTCRGQGGAKVSAGLAPRGLGGSGTPCPPPVDTPTHCFGSTGDRTGSSHPCSAEPGPAPRKGAVSAGAAQAGTQAGCGPGRCARAGPLRPGLPRPPRCPLPGLTLAQVRGGHAFLVVTTTSPSWCFSHSCVTQRFPGSDQDSPGCKEARRQVRAVSVRPSVRQPRLRAPPAPALHVPRIGTDGSLGRCPHGAPLSVSQPSVQGWGWPSWSPGSNPPRTHPRPGSPLPGPCGRHSRRRGGRSCRWCL